MDAVLRFGRHLFSIALLLFLSSPSAWGQTYVSGGSGATGGTTCTDSTFTAVAGDTIIAAFSTTNGATAVTPTITDSLGNTTGTFYSKEQDTGTLVTLTVWIYTVTAGGVDTISHTDGQGSTFWKSCAVVQYTNALTADQKASASMTSTTTWASGTTPTTTQANEVLVGIMSANSGVTWTAGTSYTLRQGGNKVSTSTGIEDQVVSATGAYQATATASANTSGVHKIITLYAGGGPPPCANSIALMGVGCR